MRNIITTIIIYLLSITSSYSNEYDFKILRVIDGDTVEIEAPYLPIELKRVLKLRVIGIDTPEKGHLAKCSIEKKNSLLARDFTDKEIKNGKVVRIKLVK